MAIARTTRPTVIVAGDVVSIRERRTREDKRLFAHTVTVQQESGAQLAFDVFIPQDGPAPQLPAVGYRAAVVVSVSESSYGASLNYEHDLTDDELEQLSRSIPAGAK